MLPLQSALAPVVAQLLRRGEMSSGKLAVAWRIAVGSGLARVASTELEPEGTLKVTTVDERWQKEIARSQGLILARLKELLGADVVKRVDVISKFRESRIPNPEPRIPNAKEQER